jgi:hypothetical protein
MNHFSISCLFAIAQIADLDLAIYLRCIVGEELYSEMKDVEFPSLTLTENSKFFSGKNQPPMQMDAHMSNIAAVKYMFSYLSSKFI